MKSIVYNKIRILEGAQSSRLLCTLKDSLFLIVLCFNIRNNLFEKAETENEFLDSKNAKNMRKSLRSAIPCTAETGVWRLFVENAIKHLDFQEIIKSSLRPAGKRRKHGASYKKFRPHNCRSE